MACGNSGSVGQAAATGGKVGSFLLRTRRSQVRVLQGAPLSHRPTDKRLTIRRGSNVAPALVCSTYSPTAFPSIGLGRLGPPESRSWRRRSQTSVSALRSSSSVMLR